MAPASIFSGTSLCVVGNLNRDIKTAPFPEGDYLFQDGETGIGGISETIGGGGAISAAVAAALGAQTDFIGRIGDDALGARLEKTLVRAGVRCHLQRALHEATGTTINLVYQSGSRHFLSCHPNNRRLNFSDLDLSCLAAATHLYRADVWFSEAMLFGGNQQLLHAARTRGLTTSLDINWDPAWGQAPASEIARRKQAVREILPLVDLVHGNVRELCEFADCGEMEAAVAGILASGATAIVLHMGASGAGYFSATEAIVQPPAPVRQRVMSTGTGDVLSVCMMLLHAGGMAIPDRLRRANEVVAEFMEGKRPFIPALV
jgi:sugar/nucleoside kinase (ribokinase family)